MQFDIASEIEIAERFTDAPPYPEVWRSQQSHPDGEGDRGTAAVWKIGENHFAPGYSLESGGAVVFSSMSSDDLDDASMNADFCTMWAHNPD